MCRTKNITGERINDNLPARTNDPTQEMNPLRNELKGNVPTRQQ
jgi:hypothetical protein